MMLRSRGFFLVSALFISACTTLESPTKPPPPPSEEAAVSVEPFYDPDTPLDELQDGAPLKTLDPNLIADAVPRFDIIKVNGNISPYQVMGKVYELEDDYRGFRQRGMASWYGTKFHGRKTSNGEIYSLYAMSAAHKTLPIPVYVKVTNLDNGRQAVVRVNDRGPFHSDRIIDLSYAAAVKLGYAEQGTAEVEIEVIDTDNMRTAALAEQAKYYLQVGAFSQLSSANRLQAKLSADLSYPVAVASGDDALHRVRIGPFADYPSAQAAKKLVKKRWTGGTSLIVEHGDKG